MFIRKIFLAAMILISISGLILLLSHPISRVVAQEEGVIAYPIKAGEQRAGSSSLIAQWPDLTGLDNLMPIEPLAVSEQELKTDDGSVEAGVVQDGLMMVNRFTPSNYPSTLERIRIRFDTFQGLPSPLGRPIRLVVFADSNGSGQPAANPYFLIDQLVTIPQTGGFVDFTVLNKPVLVTGDLYIGYQLPAPAQGVGFSMDKNGPQQQASFFSLDSGHTFAPFQFSDHTTANLMVRAVVSYQSSPSDEELKIDDGSVDGRGVIQDGLMMVNRLTPSHYPVTLKSIRALFTQFQGLPSPLGQRVRLVAFLDPGSSGKPPSSPAMLVDQMVTIPQLNTFVDLPVNLITITSGDLYVGYQVPTPANGIGFSADTNGFQQQRTFFSNDSGLTFSGPAQFSDGTKFNAMLRAVVGGSSGSADFTLSISPPAQTIVAGTSTSYTISANGLNGFNQSINLSAGINPGNANLSASLSSFSILPGGSALLNVATTANAPRSSFTVTVTGSSGALTHSASVTLIVTDNTTLPTVSVTASDANAGEAAGNTATFTITRNGSSGGPLLINYTMSGSATNGLDYQLLSGSATIPTGALSTSVSVIPIDDSLSEGDESVVMTLINGNGYQVGSPAGASATIADNDAATSVKIFTGSATITEMNSGGFIVTRTGTGNALTVNYSVSGSAVADSDYAALTGNVTIPAGATQATIPIMPLVDMVAESSETIILTILPAPGYQPGQPDNATITITDNTLPGGGTITTAQGGIVATSDGAGAIFPPNFADRDATVSFSRTTLPPKKIKKPKDDRLTVSGVYTLNVNAAGMSRGIAMLAIPVVPSLIPTTIGANKVFQPEYAPLGSNQWTAVGRISYYDEATQQVYFDTRLAQNNGAEARESLQQPVNSGQYRVRVYIFSISKTALIPNSRFEVSYYPPKLKTAYSTKDNSKWTSCSGLSDPIIPNFVLDLDYYLDNLYAKFISLPGTPFGELSLPQQALVTNCGGDAGESPLGGPLKLSNTKIENCLDMKTVAAHELAHVFQGQKYLTGGKGFITSWVLNNGWFIEAVANYYAALAAGLDENQKAEFWQKDGGIVEYLSVPITEKNDNSMYAVAHLLDWASNKYGSNLVANVLNKRGVTSPIDLNNLSAALTEGGAGGGLSGTFNEYGQYLLTHPDDYNKMNDNIKTKLAYYGLSNGLLSGSIFSDKTYYLGYGKQMKPLSMGYLLMKGYNTKDALLVIDSHLTVDSGALTSYTYDFIGSSNASYSGKTPLDSNDLIPYNKPLTIKHFGKGQLKDGIEQLIINTSTSSDALAALNYYLLIAPEITSIDNGTISWTFEGVAEANSEEKGLIPRYLIKGFNIYDQDGVKVNSSPVPLVTAGSSQSYSHAAIKPGSYKVTIVDIFDNSWPEVNETALTLDKLTRVGIGADLFFKEKAIKYVESGTGEEKTYYTRPFTIQAAFSLTPNNASFGIDSITAASVRNDYGNILNEFELQYQPGSKTVSSVTIKAALKSCSNCSLDTNLEITPQKGFSTQANWSQSRVSLVDIYKAAPVTSAFEIKLTIPLTGAPAGCPSQVTFENKDLTDTIPGYSYGTNITVGGTR